MKKAGFLCKFTLNFIIAPHPGPPRVGEGELNKLKNAPKIVNLQKHKAQGFLS